MKKEKRMIIFILIIVCAIAVICFLKPKQENKEQKTSDSVDQALDEIRNEQQADYQTGKEEKNEKHIIISNELKELLTDEQLKEIQGMTDTSENEDGCLVFDTAYRSQRTKMKNYIKDEIQTITKVMENENCICSYDLSKGTLNVTYEEEKNEELLMQIIGLMGMYQRIDNNHYDWLVLVHEYDGLGYSKYYVSDQGIQSSRTGTATDATITDAPSVNEEIVEG